MPIWYNKIKFDKLYILNHLEIMTDFLEKICSDWNFEKLQRTSVFKFIVSFTSNIVFVTCDLNIHQPPTSLKIYNFMTESHRKSRKAAF